MENVKKVEVVKGRRWQKGKVGGGEENWKGQPVQKKWDYDKSWDYH